MVKNLKRLKKQTERELGKAEGQRSVFVNLFKIWEWITYS